MQESMFACVCVFISKLLLLLMLEDTERLQIYILIGRGKSQRTDGAEFSTKV